jgi:Tol biopolymer transport system component
MSIRTIACAALLVVVATGVHAQLAVTRTSFLPLDTTKEWNAPRFSPDGQRIFLTDTDYRGIYEYSLATRHLRCITSDLQAGFGFAVAPEGRHIAYRRSVTDAKGHEARQELVLHDLVTDSSVTVLSGDDVPLPGFSAGGALYAGGDVVRSGPSRIGAAGVAIVGIGNGKIILTRSGERTVFDPYGNGDYIWPSISPDTTRILAYEIGRGTFVCTMTGKILAELGRLNAPMWTRDGRWIVYMEDKDNGDQLIASDLYCIRPDGTGKKRLTETRHTLELYPRCSPTADLIVCCTDGGKILLLEYGESSR